MHIALQAIDGRTLMIVVVAVAIILAAANRG